ncbi:hypothetical protein M407DRAFT_89673 [Tulasnella calospora MUT 4182]|uniref:COX assembly mitochondrial protein n=1 Tax=Tulasnella calospora MUT 4182 TaxID=1051891 RepID=A0A0C3MM39_9AGAM|nr:hypothetical protein M407DRAFT_89673 [Tulasnella calospora MUT 4182]
MHVHLTQPDKAAACKDLIEQLHQCHESGLLAKYTGVCNDAKRALDRCLRQERLDRTARNRDAAKVRDEKWSDAQKKYAEL